MIDVGCGTGDNLDALEEIAGRTVVGVELSPYAVRHAPPAAAGAVRVGVSRAEDLPFASGSADLITSMDVIEHLDDDAALAEYRRVVRPGGLVLLTVPAYPWLWSAPRRLGGPPASLHACHAARRRRRVRSSVPGAPRTSTRSSCPPAAVMRRTPVRRLITVEQDEVGAASPIVDRAMTALARAERRRLRRGRGIPFGLSIAALAERP